ncbi:DUF2993 domain-containing protein [Streptomyces sp. NBC_01136]|uniref:LmeA family phospholipid-binding protein n=1 Tax=unclassified Streptomyces TaxID=2593676 RepID=UPI003243C2C2|nr:DUF2993 domain-containing protein [Streptomyces sp. NBC_01136]
MRALRIILIVTVILGGLFVIADRVAVGFAENKAADRIKSTEGLASTPDVSIEGFPFLTQVVGGTLDDVKIGIKEYEASTGGGTGGGGGTGTIRIDDLNAEMHGVSFNGDYSSATANSASGSATVAYAALLKAVKPALTPVGPGVTAEVVGLSDGGNGKIKVSVKVAVGGSALPEPVSVLSSVTVVGGNTVRVHADSLPEVGVALAENRVRAITDFEQKIDRLPGGIQLDKVEAAANGVNISVKGSDVKLVG